LSIHSAEFGWIINSEYHTAEGGLHPSWDKEWGKFFSRYPGKTPPVSDIFAQLNRMKKDFDCILKNGKQRSATKSGNLGWRECDESPSRRKRDGIRCR
jgi:hypothetical protein